MHQGLVHFICRLQCHEMSGVTLSCWALCRYEALELSGDFHKGAAAVYEGLAHLKGTPPDKSAADMAAELAETASKKLQIKRACASPKQDLDF